MVSRDRMRSRGTVMRVEPSSEMSSVLKIPEPLPSVANDMVTPFISTLLRASQAGSALSGRELRSMVTVSMSVKVREAQGEREREQNRAIREKESRVEQSRVDTKLG